MGVNNSKHNFNGNIKKINNSNVIEIRSYIVGDPGVGKFSLFNRLMFDDFDEDTSQIKTKYYHTNKDYFCKTAEIDNIILNLCLMQYNPTLNNVEKSMIPPFGHVVIYVFDITNKESFNNIPKWEKLVNSLDRNGHKFMSVLVGNKTDDNNKRQVLYNEAKMLASEYNMEYFETSAKLNMGLDELLTFVIKNARQEIMESPRLQRKQQTGGNVNYVAQLDMGQGIKNYKVTPIDKNSYNVSEIHNINLKQNQQGGKINNNSYYEKYTKYKSKYVSLKQKYI